MKTLFQRRIFIATLLMFPLFACAQTESDPYIAGQHYAVLKQAVKTRNPKKVEVVEVFWYGCSHCYSFEPMLQAWVKEQAADVDFWQSPALWRDVMVVHARAYFTAQQLNKLEVLHQATFDAMNVDRNPLQDENAVATLFAKHGVSQEDFSKAYNSFSVTSGVRLADSRARNYEITGTPEMIVNGKYRVSARMAGSQKGMLEVVDFLIKKERKALGAPPA